MADSERVEAFRQFQIESAIGDRLGDWEDFDAPRLMGHGYPVEEADLTDEWNDRFNIFEAARPVNLRDHLSEPGQFLDTAQEDGALRVLDALARRRAQRQAAQIFGVIDDMVEPMRTAALNAFYYRSSEAPDIHYEMIASGLNLSIETVEFLLQAALQQIDAALDG